jgi:phage tail sheath gpL-like
MWVASRGAGTVTAVDPGGQIVANLEAGPQPNHLMADGHGAILVINRGTDPAAPQTDRITRLRAAQ